MGSVAQLVKSWARIRRAALFCFVNKRANRLKILWWDRNGYCLLYKRLHRAIFVMPKIASDAPPVIDAKELARLLAGVAKERRRTRQST